MNDISMNQTNLTKINKKFLIRRHALKTIFNKKPYKCSFLAAIVLLCSNMVACTPNTDDNTTRENSMSQSSKKNIVYFNVNLYSYLERSIFDVTLNGRHIGVAGGPPHRGRGGIITGVPVPLGEQKISWRLGGPEGMPGNGDTVHAINTPFLERPDPKFTYLGVHIYPDNTVELVPEEFWPEKTERGMEINRKWEQDNE